MSRVSVVLVHVSLKASMAQWEWRQHVTDQRANQNQHLLHDENLTPHSHRSVSKWIFEVTFIYYSWECNFSIFLKLFLKIAPNILSPWKYTLSFNLYLTSDMGRNKLLKYKHVYTYTCIVYIMINIFYLQWLDTCYVPFISPKYNIMILAVNNIIWYICTTCKWLYSFNLW